MEYYDPEDNKLFLDWSDDTIVMNGNYLHPVTEETLHLRENLLRDFMNIPATQIKVMIEHGNYIIAKYKYLKQKQALNLLFNEVVKIRETDDNKFYILEPSEAARRFVKGWILDEAEQLKKKLNYWRTNYDSRNRRPC